MNHHDFLVSKDDYNMAKLITADHDADVFKDRMQRAKRNFEKL